MRLFIAEKPSVAKAIAEALGQTGKGDGYIECGGDRVTWCFGHMLEQAEPDAYLPDSVPKGKTGKKVWREEDLPIIPQQWILQPRDDAKAQLKNIAKLLKEAKTIVNAGDPDREGQLLVDEILEHYNCRKPTQRFWVSAQDSTSIKRGLAALKDNAEFAGFGRAALARGRADWLIGMNLSRAYTLGARRAGSESLLSVGRVQTPTLALVVARDREIESFKPVPFFTIAAAVQHAHGSFRAKWEPREEQVGLDSEGRLVDAAAAEALIQAVTGKAGTIAHYEVTPKSEAHPKAFALSDITLLASNRFGYSADAVLKACQSLYETHKLTSYPRTDCAFLPESQHADAPAVLAAVKKTNPELAAVIDKCDTRIKSKTWNDAKVTAHHGIIPTMQAGNLAALSPAERNIYELIVKAYLAQFYPAHEYLATKISVAVAGETFTAGGKTITANGWRDVFQGDDSEKSEDDDSGQTLPKAKSGDPVTCAKAVRQDKKTKAPSRFTEGTLQKAMENVHRFVADPEHRKLLREGDGIGTSATRASIISELKRKGFLEASGKAVVSSKLGRSLIDALPEVVKSPVLTAVYERMLKDIEAQKTGIDAFIAKQEQFVRDQVAKVAAGGVQVQGGASSGPVCPECKQGTLKRWKRKDGSGHFWGCSRFKEGCKASFDDKGGKPVKKAAAKV